jgi:hypothetical protein
MAGQALENLRTQLYECDGSVPGALAAEVDAKRETRIGTQCRVSLAVTTFFGFPSTSVEC